MATPWSSASMLLLLLLPLLGTFALCHP